MGKSPFVVNGYSYQIDNYCPQCDQERFVSSTKIHEIGAITLKTYIPSYMYGTMVKVGFEQSAPSPSIKDAGSNSYVEEIDTFPCFVAEIACPGCSRLSAVLLVDRLKQTYREDGKTIQLDFHSYIPSKKLHPPIPNSIKELSPRFVNVYQQAVNAKSDSYDELAGFGFRKALEILTKEYLLSKTMSEKERVEIENMKLVKTIDHIDHPQLTQLMHGVREGGNDETHYLKKYDFSVEELQSMIELVMQLLDIRIQTDDMNSRIQQELDNTKQK